MTKKILLVDDDKDLADTLAAALAANNYNVASAYSGTEGLKKIPEFSPDLLVLDVMMETDTAGFELAYQVRNKRETSHLKEYKDIPIIILTAIDQVTNSRFSLDEQESFLPGIDEFLTKPVNIDDLLNKVNNCLK